MSRLGTPIVLLCAYFLFSGQAGKTELIAALPAVTLAWSFALIKTDGRRQNFRSVPWPRIVARTISSLFADSFRVGVLLLSAIMRRQELSAGMVARQSFHFGETDADTARRALVILCASLAPNGYVFCIDRNADILYMHRLVAVPPRADMEWSI